MKEHFTTCSSFMKQYEKASILPKQPSIVTVLINSADKQLNLNYSSKILINTKLNKFKKVFNY